MRYLEIIRENTDGKMSFWGLAEHFGVEKTASDMNDATLPWINNNSRSRMDKLVGNKKMRLASKLKLFMTLKGHGNYGTPVATPAEFEQALREPVTLWRGGGGVYDPARYQGPWTSFTAKEGRAETFSKYDGTYATRAFRLPLRDQYWIVKLTIPLDDILMYLPHGSDEEVIISTEDAKKAEVVVQTEPGQSGEKQPMKFPKASDYATPEEYKAAQKEWAAYALS